MCERCVRRSQPAGAAACAGRRCGHGVACGGRQPRGLATGAGELPALLPVRFLSRCDVVRPPPFSPIPRSRFCRTPSLTSPHTPRFSVFSFSLSPTAARAISLSSSTPLSFTSRRPRSSPPFFFLCFPLSLSPRFFSPSKPSPARSASSPRTRAAISASPPPPTPITTSSTPRPSTPPTPPSTSTNSTSACSTLSTPTSCPCSPPSRRSAVAKPPSSTTPPPSSPSPPTSPPPSSPSSSATRSPPPPRKRLYPTAGSSSTPESSAISSKIRFSPTPRFSRTLRPPFSSFSTPSCPWTF